MKAKCQPEQTPWGTLALAWLYGVIWSWEKGAKLSYSHFDQSLNEDCPEKGPDLGECGSVERRLSQKGLSDDG